MDFPTSRPDALGGRRTCSARDLRAALKLQSPECSGGGSALEVDESCAGNAALNEPGAGLAGWRQGAARSGASSEAMKEETCEGPVVGQGSERAGKAPGRAQPEAAMEPQEEPGRGMQKCWEAQWQDFIKTLQASHSAWSDPQLSKAVPWDDAKAFLASFEQVAAACHWPRAEWVAQLLPALSGDAQQAFSLLAARDKEDYGKVKAAILRGEVLRREMQRQHFRQFCCQELGDPRRMYSQVQELCCQWLKPERRTKEQILELLVLEQFLASLPVDVQSWIQAGGPDSGAQAVALLEDFLLSQKEADTVMWQEPFQEWAVGLLDAKEEPLDKVQEDISREHSEILGNTPQNVDGEGVLPDKVTDEAEKSKTPGVQVDQRQYVPPFLRGQEVCGSPLHNTSPCATELEVGAEGVNPKKLEVPLHVVERTPMESSLLWKVLPEDDENVDSLDDGKGTQLKNSQAGGNKPVEAPRTGQERTEEKVPLTAEVKEEISESTRGQELETHMGRKESGEPAESLRCASSDPSLVDPAGGKASFSKYGGRYCPKSGFVFEHTGAECDEDHPLGEKIQLQTKLDKHHSSQQDEQNQDRPELGIRLYSNSLVEQHIIHPGEKNHNCPNCGKSFSRRSNLLAHQMIHAGKQPYKCPDCGKSFSQRSPLLKHQSIHTGNKPYQCPDCGKSFCHRSSMLTHQIIHTGNKPHKCSECGKGFSRKFILLMHQSTHTGEKPHKCPKCGKGFSRSSHLLIHQAVHTGKKPHQCPDCERSFIWRSKLLMHQTIHTGEKPHKCPDCGKNFSRKSSLLGHQMRHTGKKPYKCSECERSFFSRSNLQRHQSIHVGEKPHQCPACGKSFSQRSHLLRHQKIHIREEPHKYPDC